MRIILLGALLTFKVTAIAQTIDKSGVKNPPVSVESVMGSRGLTFQTIVQKKLQSVPRLGIFAISDMVGVWDKTKANDFMLQGNLTYEFAKGFNVTGGFHITSGINIRPAFGVMYAFNNPTWLVVVYPRAYIDDLANLEGFGMAEFKPKLTEQWRLYTRAQANYNFTASNGDHARSYARFRTGVTYREFSFGAAANLDYYGPKKISEPNYGGFITVKLF